MEVSTLNSVLVSTLFTMGRPTGGSDYTWMRQQLVEYLRYRFPQDGCLFTNVDYIELSPSNKVYTLPSGAVSVTKIGYLKGNKVFSLSKDGSLALPNLEEFMCDGYPNSSVVESSFPNFMGSFGAPSYSSSTDGRGVNYYRQNGRQIIFSNEIPNGKLVIEYLGFGDIGDGTVIELAYVGMIKNYLMREFHLHRGDKAMVDYHTRAYEADGYNTNTLLYSPMLREITDAVKRSTHLNLS